MAACFWCGGIGRVTSVSPSRAVREIPCPLCSPESGARVITPAEARKPGPARVAATLLAWAAVLAVALLVLSFLALVALFRLLGGMEEIPL